MSPLSFNSDSTFLFSSLMDSNKMLFLCLVSYTMLEGWHKFQILVLMIWFTYLLICKIKWCLQDYVIPSDIRMNFSQFVKTKLWNSNIAFQHYHVWLQETVFHYCPSLFSRFEEVNQIMDLPTYLLV